jgi:Mg/Co/Ni transporter MgtE
MKRSIREEIIKILTHQNRITLQNVLMKIPDREIAVSLSVLNIAEKEKVFALLSPEKRKRVEEEFKYQEKLDIRHDRYLKIINKFLSYFEPGKKQFRNHSYIRPKRRS